MLLLNEILIYTVMIMMKSAFVLNIIQRKSLFVCALISGTTGSEFVHFVG